MATPYQRIKQIQKTLRSKRQLTEEQRAEIDHLGRRIKLDLARAEGKEDETQNPPAAPAGKSGRRRPR